MEPDDRGRADGLHDVAAQQIWSGTLDIYAGFLAGDRAGVDSHLHPDVTLWDSAEPELIHGLSELGAVRDRRPAGERPGVLALDAADPVIDVWGDVALARHWLTVRYADPAVPPESVRVTAVWRLTAGRWLAVHNHEDVRPTPR